ncbi:uncharacterized protein B0I36DRAFT_65614 [Microdochium trichocladiopsis]|uniref:Uncharacterized protein n=1 Tax=Microdochium trichocladiopsis TaxID=1682393 RepID=A0A9P9BUF1_9PEZI|nr:uncharacterized protein B0I36DRAFT_65614 [Microdochium trichocladiopsis]KAH7037409.1 hypothetical protein B0I36DRAFT_65614 [Microdochium trichocladiopsis]
MDGPSEYCCVQAFCAARRRTRSTTRPRATHGSASCPTCCILWVSYQLTTGSHVTAVCGWDGHDNGLHGRELVGWLTSRAVAGGVAGIAGGVWTPWCLVVAGQRRNPWEDSSSAPRARAAGVAENTTSPHSIPLQGWTTAISLNSARKHRSRVTRAGV